MPDTKSEDDGASGPTVGDSGLLKLQDIKPERSPSSMANKSPSTASIHQKSDKIKHSPSNISPLKRKHSPDSNSDYEIGKRSKLFGLFSSSPDKMSLDINDIDMPGRSGSTRSRTKVPAQERRRVPVA